MPDSGSGLRSEARPKRMINPPGRRCSIGRTLWRVKRSPFTRTSGGWTHCAMRCTGNASGRGSEGLGGSVVTCLWRAGGILGVASLAQ